MTQWQYLAHVEPILPTPRVGLAVPWLPRLTEPVRLRPTAVDFATGAEWIGWLGRPPLPRYVPDLAVDWTVLHPRLWPVSRLMPAEISFTTRDAFKVVITVAGVERQANVLPIQGSPWSTLTVSEALNDEPDTATFRVKGFVPREGHAVTIVNGWTKLFGGSVARRTQVNVGTKANVEYELFCVDWTRLLNRRLVNAKYTAGTVYDNLISLITDFTSGFTTNNVDMAALDAINLDEITFTDEPVASAISRLMKRAGGYWYVDADRDIHAFLEDSADPPAAITDLSTPEIESLVIQTDVMPVRTRIFVEGGGVNALTEVPVGETILPVADTAWYSATGGIVKSGPQRITYASIVEGGTGGLVGPGAAPSSGPALAMAAGAGVESGAHGYAVTFTTAAGESIAGPTVLITVGTIPVPSSAPSGSLSSGGSVNAGDHHYEYTFVTATGETTPSPISGVFTTGGAAASPPTNAPTAGTPSTGGSVTDGAHYYATTFVTPSGETAAGPTSNTVTTRLVTPPSAPSGSMVAGTAGNLGVGNFKYEVSYVNAAGETTPSSNSGDVAVTHVTANGSPGSPSGTTGGSLTLLQRYHYLLSYTTAVGETTAAGTCEIILTGSQNAVALSGISVSSDGRVTGKKLYRLDVTEGGTFEYKLVATLSAGATTHTDTVSHATQQTGASQPGSNTSGSGQITVTIPTSADATVTARKIYRTVVNGGTFKLLTTISNNSATSYVDNIADGSLGGGDQSSNGATVRTVALTGIQTGPVGTTARKLYRTAAGGSTLKLLTTISDNTTTTFNDTIADGSLGADAPSGATLNTVNLTGIAVGNAAVTSRKVYRRFNSAGTFKLLTTIADNSTTTYTDTTANASLGVDAPSSNTATANRVSLSAIPIGGAGVTGRKLYRTVAAGAQLKLLATIADNSTTTYADSTADASLGANVPTSDLSGLAQPEGQVAAGATTLIVANSAGFAAAGGWAVIGNGQQVIRYTGKTASTLTGIPASGTGAIVASIAYNSSITQAPALIGIPASGAGSILYTIKYGDPVNLVAQVDAPSAQSIMATLEGGDGIHEHPIQDNRLVLETATARGEAELDRFKSAIVTVSYQTHDPLTRAGKTVTFDLATPTSLVGDFVIQRVVRSEFTGLAGSYPRCTVEASNVKFSLEDLLRRALIEQGG